MTSFVSLCVSPCQTELEFASFYLKRIRQRENCISLADFLCLDTRTRNIVYFSLEKFTRIQFYARVTGIAPKKRKFLRKWYRRTMDKMTRAKVTSNWCQSYTANSKSMTLYKNLRKNKKKTCEPYNVNEYYLYIVTNKQ